MAETPRIIEFDPDSLYIILTRQSPPNPWHWGLYLHINDDGGRVFHIRNFANDPTWFYECKSSSNIVQSMTIIVALRVAIIKPEDMRGALQSFLGTTQSGISMADPNQFGTLTCRTWVMQALYELDQGGYISIIPGYTVRDIEIQATETALLNSLSLELLTSKELLINCHYSRA